MKPTYKYVKYRSEDYDHIKSMVSKLQKNTIKVLKVNRVLLESLENRTKDL